MKIFGKKFDDKKAKKILYTAVLAVLAIWFIYRFVMVAIESHMVVFNPIRETNKNGFLVETVVVSQKEHIIKIPMSIKNNRAYVSRARRGQFKVGQKIGDGEIVSVSSSVDLDSGMYVVRTRGVIDGLKFVSVPVSGYCIPAYAVRDGRVSVVDNGVATVHEVQVINQDSDTACIAEGIADGDVVILSKVVAGQKVRVK